jgi:hypothetical protein
MNDQGCSNSLRLSRVDRKKRRVFAITKKEVDMVMEIRSMMNMNG